MSLDAAHKRFWKETSRQVWRVLVGLVGFMVLLAGIVMLVTPGPAFIVIPLGLGILATQFVWARRVLHQFRTQITKFKQPSNAAPALEKTPDQNP